MKYILNVPHIVLKGGKKCVFTNMKSTKYWLRNFLVISYFPIQNLHDISYNVTEAG